MKVIVDTCIWSAALRRQGPGSLAQEVSQLTELVKEGRVVMLGVIRQELLSGIKSSRQFKALRDKLRAYPDYPVSSEDYEVAAELFNRCRSKGIQGSNTDFLLCAIAIQNRWPIFTVDKDFGHYAKQIKVKLYDVTRKSS